MSWGQAAILGILAATAGLFLWGRWRHDMVAVASLLLCLAAGLVEPAKAFSGFGHPAVVTVACVLILSRALQTTGAVDALARRVLPTSAGPTLAIAALTSVAALLSGFMNNVGALALLMPVALQLAARLHLAPGRVLMPLAFGSILGGMTTLIGTPPNLIVSAFRAEAGGGTFGMFDFTPVGAAVAGAGVLFVALIGWRLVPARERTDSDGFETGAYLTEVRVTEGSRAEGRSLLELAPLLEEADAQIVGTVKNQLRVSAPSPATPLRAGDILVVEAEPQSLAALLTGLGLPLEEDVTRAAKTGVAATADPDSRRRSPAELELLEVTVRPDSPLVGRSATDIRLRTRFGIDLLAVSRQGRRSIRRLRSTIVRPGDLLLLQGPPAALPAFANDFGCVPLAPRSLRIPDRAAAATALGVMAVAVGGAALGLLPAAVSFAAGVLALMVLEVLSPRAVYEAVDWPVIVLLGALIPVAGAMATTGAAGLLARAMLTVVGEDAPMFGLAVILIVTMTLSDFMNNAATAAVMCPVAMSAASQLGVGADPFLMAVAVGSSCAFLTPIGHQNNTLILGPGGFRFGDYWRLGLPLEVIVVAVAVPAIAWAWGL